MATMQPATAMMKCPTRWAVTASGRVRAAPETAACPAHRAPWTTARSFRPLREVMNAARMAASAVDEQIAHARHRGRLRMCSRWWPE